MTQSGFPFRPAMGPGPARAMSSVRDEEKTRLLAMAESGGNMGHWYWTLANGAMNWSEHIYRIAGRDPAQFVPTSDSFWDVVDPADRAFVASQFDKAIAGRGVVEFDVRFVRPNGDVRNVIMKCQPELSEGTTPVALFGVLTDVTDAFSALRSIQDQHEMLDLAAELAHLGHWVWSADVNAITYCSEQLAKIHELTPDVFLTRFSQPVRITSVIEPEYREGYVAAITAALSAGTPYQLEYKLETRFALSRHIKEIGQPIFDDQRKLVRFIGTVQDISEAKRRELLLRTTNEALEVQTLALKRSEAKLRDIVEGSIQGILILRRNKILFANPAFAKMLGLSSVEEFSAIEDIRQFMSSDTKVDTDFFWAEVTSRRLDGLQRRSMLRSIHGREVWIDAVGRLIEWEGGPAFLLSVVDVTDRHRSEKALIEKSKELEELNLQKDKLFSIIAHDLKGPFNSVLGFAGLLAAKAPKMAPEKVAEYAEVIYTAATSVHDLLDNLLTWASVQMRTTQLRKAPIDLHAVVDASFYPLQGMANEKAITVSNDIQDVTALGDEAMVRIVLRNLISNGIKFTPKGGTVTVSAEVQSGANAKPFVRVCVCDSGVGMSRATLDSLFSFTGQTSSTGTQGEKGTGLGLFLCRDIVERHGGRLTVESQPGKGSALTFTLPLPPSTP